MNGRPELSIVGLISGTSADGVDAALVSISGVGGDTGVSVRRCLTVPYAPEVREDILSLARGAGSASDVARWHYRLGKVFADAALMVLRGERVDAVASHGQTVSHVADGSGERATLQLGHPAVIAAATGATVVSDFRAADIVAGGQGAPLVSFADCLLLRHNTAWRVALNIGGIANVTSIPPLTSDEDPIAFDTGPGNSLVDRLAQRLCGAAFDADGARAAHGAVSQALLRALLCHPYLQRLPPKSTGLEEFGDGMVERILADAERLRLTSEDVLATATQFTAASISLGIASLEKTGPGGRHAVDEIVVSGGGAHNRTLMRFLRGELPRRRIVESDALGLPIDGKEAIVFAVLANQTLHGQPATVPSCTGARYPALLGSITPGANFRALMSRLNR